LEVLEYTRDFSSGYRDDLKGFKDAFSRTGTKNKRRRNNQKISPGHDNSVVTMLERPTVSIEKAFLEDGHSGMSSLNN
jgi:hypothetical protein